MRFRRISAFIGLLILVQVAGAGTMGAQAIATQVDGWLSQYSDELLTKLDDPAVKLTFRVMALDTRLQLAACEAPLNIRTRDGDRLSQRLTLEVSCPSGTRWRIYVPVALELTRPVVVATRPIPRGTVVTAADIQLREMDVASLNGSYYLTTEGILGQVAKRNIRLDEVLLHSNLSPPLVVAKGDEVVISAVSNGLEVKVPGTALSDGRAGEQIPVRNRSSERIVDARITGPGQVEVVM